MKEHYTVSGIYNTKTEFIHISLVNQALSTQIENAVPRLPRSMLQRIYIPYTNYFNPNLASPVNPLILR